MIESMKISGKIFFPGLFLSLSPTDILTKVSMLKKHFVFDFIVMVLVCGIHDWSPILLLER